MKISSFLLLIFFAIQTSAQDYHTPIDKITFKGTYNLWYQPDTTRPGKYQRDKVLLQVGENISKSLSLNLFLRDSIIMHVEPSVIWSDMRIFPPVNFYFQVFKNHPNGKITTIDNVFTDVYTYTEAFDLFDWVLTGEKDSISGYECQKATTTFAGRDWIAWFSPEIPVSDGPYKFHGLPGLIIRVYDTNHHYNFDLESFRPEENQNNVLFTKRTLIPTTKKVFLEAQKRFLRNAAGTILAGNEAMAEHPESLERIERAVSMFNNPIELKAE